MTETEDSERLDWKATQDRIRSLLFPIHIPLKYESETELYAKLRDGIETNWDPTDDRYLDVASSSFLFSQRINQRVEEEYVFTTVPYLFLHGPPDSGKTRLLDLARLLCRDAIKSSSMTAAAIYQFLTDKHGTLCVDETDSWGLNSRRGPSERIAEIMPILNSGYKRGDYVVRANREGGNPIYYDTFGLKLGAGTQLWPVTLTERCIVLEQNENMRTIPSDIDIKALEPLQRMLEMYHEVYDLGKAAAGNPQPHPVDLKMDDLRDKLGDNRTAELYFGPYACCPTEQGRKALLELATESLEARGEGKADSDIGHVAESVISVWLMNQQRERPDFLTTESVTAWHSEYPVNIKDHAKWIGHKLSDLSLKPLREPHGGPRGVTVSAEKLARIDRQFRLYLLHPQPVKKPDPAPSATNGTNGTIGTNDSGIHSVVTLNRSRIDTSLVTDYILTKAMQIEHLVVGYSTLEQVEYHVSHRFGEEARTLVLPQLTMLAEQGRIQAGPFTDCWRLVK